jgi:putative FmdB family regulatory protein
MPVYEFRCNSCQQKTSFLLKGISEPLSPHCPACGSEELTRLISNFTYHKSMRIIHEESGDPDRAGPDYYNDPRNIGRWAEKRFKEMGLEMPSHVDEMIHAAREGEMPESVKDIQPGLTEV